MRYAIIADIHANLPALRAVLRDIELHGCDQIACLGDVVGYHTHPKECLAIIRRLGIPCVKGNHDEYCSSEVSLEGFNGHAADAVRWTRRQLSEDECRWLQALPFSMTLSGFTLVHATLDHPRNWGYVFDKLAAASHFLHQTTPVCFCGHTHVPLAFVRDTVVSGGTYSRLQLEPAKQYLVNVGSVGQPRDNNPKAAYAIYDMENALIELLRVEYLPSEEDERGTVRG